MKKSRYVLCAVLALTCVFVLCGCSAFDISALNFGQTTITTAAKSNVPDYGEVSVANVAEAVAGASISSIYEVTCEISYSYRASSWFGGSSGVRTQSVVSQGTAFCVNEDGYLLTNAHVINVEDSSSIYGFSILTRNVYVSHADTDDNLECEIVAYNESLDLALLKVKTQTSSYTLVGENGGKYVFDFLPFFNHVDPAEASNGQLTLHYGETAVVIGNANGYGIAVTDGVVSAPVRRFRNSDGSITKAIQTDAAINPGNSGGPLLNAYSAVIGINSFKIVKSDTESMGYAIPSYVATAFLDSFADGTYSKTDTISSTHGVAYSGTIKVNYYTVSERAYKADGSNLVAKYN